MSTRARVDLRVDSCPISPFFGPFQRLSDRVHMSSFRGALAEPIRLSEQRCRHVAGQVADEFRVTVGDLHALRDVDALDAVVSPALDVYYAVDAFCVRQTVDRRVLGPRLVSGVVIVETAFWEDPAKLLYDVLLKRVGEQCGRLSADRHVPVAVCLVVFLTEAEYDALAIRLDVLDSK